MTNLYANSKDTGFTRKFIAGIGKNPSLALLAAPFFSYTEPLQTLTSKGCNVKLIVRLSPITTPKALEWAIDNPLVHVHYFTSQRFHTKLYIIDDQALVGSANLTESGLNSNVELSVLLTRDRDEVFEQLPTIFDKLWGDSDVLTTEIFQNYARAFSQKGGTYTEYDFEKFIEKYVPPVAPQSVLAGSDKISRERAFLQAFRRKYDEALIPAHKEIMEVALESGFGRPEYFGQDPQIEMGRFLGWLRLVHGEREGWIQAPLLEKEARAKKIREYISIWQSTDDTVHRDMYDAKAEIENIRGIRDYLCVDQALSKLNMDQIFDLLSGCHAFIEQLRFVDKTIGEGLSGRERLRIAFNADNNLASVKRTISYLLSGPGDMTERAYDCIYNEKYKLSHFGEASVMELLGWGTPSRPPFNNRTIRGMRFLGFDVAQYVAKA